MLRVRRSRSFRLRTWIRVPLVFACLLAVLAACDNVGRAWDRKGGGGGGKDESPATAIRVPEAGDVVRSTRPSILLASPSGSALPPTTPVVLLFDETMNADSIRASTGDTPSHLFVRAQGSDAAVPGVYRFFLDGRCVVFTPTTGFPRATYEVVVGSQVADLDKQKVLKAGVVTTFTTDGTVEAGLRVIAAVPSDKERFVRQVSSILTVLSAPVDETTVDETTYFLEDSSNAKVEADIKYPVTVQNVRDTRFLELDPKNDLDGGATYRLSITNGIMADKVRLDPGRRNPIVSFTTSSAESPSTVAIGNPTAGFPLGINRDNLPALAAAVSAPAATRTGDKVVARVYGFDASKTVDTQFFVGNSASATKAGADTVSVALGSELGAVDAPRLKDGAVSLVAWIERGSEVTGAIRIDDLSFDVTPPELTTLGPPGDATTFVTDLGFSALFGTASERLGKLELTVGATTLGLAGTDETGRFWSQPVLLTRSATPVAFALAMFDRAGNRAAATTNGRIVQRGFLTGSVTATNTIDVEVYDEATFEVVPGARVLVEPGLPQKPSIGRVLATTDANGMASFTGRTDPNYSVTVIADGYHLRTVLATTAARISLPLRPIADATSIATVNLTFLNGSRTRVGINVLDDDTLGSSVATTAASVRKLTNVAIRPNRPVFLSGFAGTFPPTQKPTYDSGGTQIGATSSGRGSNGVPLPSPSGGATVETTVAMLPASQGPTPLFRNLAASYAVDFGVAAGLDTANLVDAPRVSFEMTLSGLAGSCYIGPGIASGGPANFTIDGSFSSTALADFSEQGQVLWSTVQATDRSGNSSRNRSYFASALLGAVTRLAPAAGVPTILAPAGTFTGSPAVQFSDRLDASAISPGLAVRELRARDPAGRRWTVLGFDGDAAGGTDTVQFPDLSGAGVTGLSAGSWSIDAVDRLLVSPGFGTGELVFEDLPRLEATWARSAPVVHTVQ